MIDTHEVLRARSRLFQAIRHFFDGERFIEVDTPALAPSIIPEATIEVFRTEAKQVSGSVTELYLLPSPERWMKRLVQAGEDRIYQLSHVFRNGEAGGAYHSFEFMMLEWYAAESDYHDELERTKRLLAVVGSAFGVASITDVVAMSVAEAFERFAALDLGDCADLQSFRKALDEIGCTYRWEDSWADLFHRALVERVEPKLLDFSAVVLYDYPIEVACLARRKRGTPWRERWELYMDGVEIANCYSEDTDHDSVLRYIEKESAKMDDRRERIDAALADIYRGGGRACSGVALGVDRLLMTLSGIARIDRANPLLSDLLVTESPRRG